MSLAIGAVFAALLASAVFHALLAQGQQQLDHVDQQINQAEQRYNQLRLQVDLLSAPARIVSEAGRFGMVMPGQVQLVTPPPGATSEITGGAAPSASNGDQTSNDSVTGYQAVKPDLGEQP
jgi:cell division protein FtsL